MTNKVLQAILEKVHTIFSDVERLPGDHAIPYALVNKSAALRLSLFPGFGLFVCLRILVFLSYFGLFGRSSADIAGLADNRNGNKLVRTEMCL